MNKWKAIEELQVLKAKYDKQISFFESQLPELKSQYRNSNNIEDYKLLRNVEMDISNLKAVSQSLENANNWAVRVGVKE